MRFCVSIILGLFLMAGAVFATPPELQDKMKSPAQLGETTTRFAGFKIYDAELYTPNKMSFSLEDEFALSLRYHMSFSGRLLASASVREMARFEGVDVDVLQDLRADLIECFGNVKSGDRITGHGLGKDKIAFYNNGAERCVLSYPDIRKRFFSIWLGPETRDAPGRDRLRGEAQRADAGGGSG